MNWLTFIMLGGGMILLGLAIIFLLFAEIASKLQDSGKKAGRETRLKSGSASFRNVRRWLNTTVSRREKAALGISGNGARPDGLVLVKNSAKPEQSRPS